MLFSLFELSLRMSDHNPRVDLRASNNVLHVRTCSDSARLLTQLVKYLASYGDLGDTEPPPPPSPTPTTDPSVPPPCDLSASTVQRVNTLMEEAMIDDVKDKKKQRGM